MIDIYMCSTIIFVLEMKRMGQASPMKTHIGFNLKFHVGSGMWANLASVCPTRPKLKLSTF